MAASHENRASWRIRGIWNTWNPVLNRVSQGHIGVVVFRNTIVRRINDTHRPAVNRSRVAPTTTLVTYSRILDSQQSFVASDVSAKR